MVSFTRPLIVALVCLVAFARAAEENASAAPNENPKSVTAEVNAVTTHKPGFSAVPAAMRDYCY
ncbi:hypothetical protein BGZ73_001278, partial [Actinomortierella ambigua]